MTSRRGVRLGLDVGSVRVGLAQSDPDALLATPLRTLQRDARKGSDLNIVVKEALSQQVHIIYVGLPQTLRGSESASAEAARLLAQELAGRLAAAGSTAEVRLVDERFSTTTAHRQLHQAGVPGRAHRKVVDQMAAAGILQHALEIEKSTGSPAGQAVQAKIGTDDGGTGESRAGGHSVAE
ncbi:Holliday junction resolvase RuvX [Acaricomes phytoseiuli]|uniref:Holliday junction resolvase RuvX n=1 Tax=Acaricomes phytoseiuli TaxID=291968 RepID=UPI00036A8B05|nr:Holliday junction resolvase RuvX [Acaricomes phytoseiuli]MCW1250322.1 Holliday junction resolvase RuvX [Acaricomes phytoseiuli]